MTTQSPPVAVAVLDSAVAYAHAALEDARSSPPDLPTPCSSWDLGSLLLHMEDSLTVIGEAASLGYVEVVDPPRTGGDDQQADQLVDRLVDRVVERACRTMAAWHERITSAPIGVDDLSLARDELVLVAALEVAVHGWDVVRTTARLTGVGRAIPADLAEPLLDVAVEVIGGQERGRRFGPPRFVPSSASPSARLLAYVGRG